VVIIIERLLYFRHIRVDGKRDITTRQWPSASSTPARSPT
jgi:hypothetical protein